MSKFVDEANNIVPTLRDKEIDKEVESLRNVDPFFTLKASLFSFFHNMLLKVQEEDDFKKQVKQAILKKIETGDIEFDQLASLLKNLNHDTQDMMTSILSIFKPAPSGQISPLIEPSKSSSVEGLDAFKDLDSKERSTLDMLSRALEEARSKSSEKSD